jgi:protein-S-isoprenylcysteine O-methyltransferase Ste14
VILKFNPFEFFGIQQLISSKCPYSSSGKSTERITGNQFLITTGIFQLCRHPLYLFMLLSWTITPVMSLDRFFITVYACLYLAIGIPIEERKLIQIFGHSYINYQKSVPMIIPFINSKTKEN